MKSFLPALSLVVVFGSCTTAYKSGQTPDDVYYSPAQKKNEYNRIEEKEEERKKEEPADYATEDDRYLRMKVRNRDRWSYLDDYYRDPYAYTYTRTYYYNDYCCCNPRTYWNHYYNPYNTRVVYVASKTPLYSKPRTYNLHVFDTPNSSTGSKSRTTTSRTYSNTRDTRPATNTGNVLRDVFKGSAENNSSSNNSSGSSSNTKTSTPSSSGSSSAGSTNAPARKF